MAEKPYRFLLRMPEQLRQKLTASAQREGRSLNSEVVHRLEESVEQSSAPAAARGLRVRIADSLAGVGKPARLRVGVGFAAVLLLVVIAGTAGLLRGDSGKTSAAAASLGPRLEGELPKAIERKLAQTQKFSTTSIREGGEAVNDGAQDYAEHAYPAEWIPYGAVKGSRADWKKHTNGGFGDNPGLGGRWLSLGPDVATYPFNPFRNRFVYVPNEYVAAGRTAHSLIDPACKPGDCRYWIANAGGGIWMTRDALAPQPQWQYLSGDFDLNNTAALAFDPNDSSHDTIYAGTGEPNICRSGCLGGVGLYRSTDGGKHWGDALGADVFSARGIGSVAVKPGDRRTIYVATGAQGSRGISSVCCDGVDRGANIPGAPHFGLYRSQDYGKTWQLVSQGAPALCTASTPTDVFLNNTPCSPRGARRVIVDPTDPNTVYASFFARGIWRSNDSGSTWQQIFKPLTVPTAPATGADIERAEFDVAALPGGKTRMYIGVGGGPGQARVFRNDDVATAPAATVQAGWQSLTNDENVDYCAPQCNYDNYVYIPKGPHGQAVDPDIVYLLGSYDYNRVNVNNGRAILLSTDGGVHWTDESMDHADPIQPHGVHPDQHSITTNPLNWRQFLETSDGGIIRSNGKFVDGSGDCTAVKQITNPTLLNRCQRLTSRIPEQLQSINAGLKTLAFYQVSANPNRPGEYAAGAQDNGTWMSDPATVPAEQGGQAKKVESGSSHWTETFVADGASNSFDAKNPDYSTLSWQAGSLAALPVPRDQTKGFWIADSLEVIPPYVWEGVPFQTQSFFDPNVSMRLFTSKEHLFRSDNGGWNPAYGLARVMVHCNLWTGNGDLDEDGTYEPFTDVCDSWKPLGDPGQAGRLTYGPNALCPPADQPLAQPTVPCPAPYPWGDDRSGGYVAFFQRATSDNKTLWAATSTGRIFITKNADAKNPADVSFTRLDGFSSIDPNRFPSAIWVSSSNPNQAIVSYSGYNAVTPTTPGHIFGVTYNPATKQATWVRIDDDSLGDLPIADVQVDEQRHVLYASTDFGVLKLRLVGNGGPFRGSEKWRSAGPGLPAVAVPDLTILPDRGVLLAATHGFGAWTLKLQG